MRNFHFLNYKKSSYFFVPILVGLFLFGALFYEKEVRAAVIIVDDPTGEIADNGLCSLPEAIINANNDDQSGSVDCAAGLGADVISLAVDVVLSAGYPDIDSSYALPTIAGDTTIEGNDFSISRDLLGNDMGLVVLGTVDVVIKNVHISNFSQNGLENGVIHPGGANITIENSTFINNTVSIFFGYMSDPPEEGNWNIVNSVFRENSSESGLFKRFIGIDISISGSIFENNQGYNGLGSPVLLYYGTPSEHRISISDSIFRNNRSSGSSLEFIGFINETQVDIENTIFENDGTPSAGRAIGVYENVIDPVNFYISNSLFKGNYANGTGGAIYLSSKVNLNLENNLFIDNYAENGGGAIVLKQEGVPVNVSIEARHNTFSGNVSGNSLGTDIYQDGTTDGVSFFESNIFNSGGDECAGDLSNFTFNNNLSNDADCGNLGPVTGLGPLGLYFGSDIPTLRLLAGSNAIDTAVPVDLGCPDEDMIGQIRPNGVQCDIGVFEYYAPGSVIVELTDGDTVVSEDGTDDTYTLVLSSEPSSSVTIDFDFDNSKISISPSSVTFSTLDWNIEQVVTVSAVVDDTHYENKTDIISHTSSSSDYLFDELVIDQVTVLVENIHSQPSSTSSGGSSSYVPPVVTIEPPTDPIIWGCTNSFAQNFNPSANFDNGSCVFLPIPILGCTNSSATNFNIFANQDNGSCLFQEVVPEPVEEIQLPEEILDPTPVQLPDDFVDSPDRQDDTLLPPSDPTPSSEKNKIFQDLKIPETVFSVFEDIPERVNESVAYTGVFLPAAVFIATQPAMAASIPIRLWNIIPTLLGFKRRKRPWGTVYDSVTKQPLDPVHVTLTDLNGNVVANTITDMDGRFGFLVPAGRYKISVSKTDYNFPSIKLENQNKDELYADLYFGNEVFIETEDGVLIKNIPMDSKSFNWNEFEKSKNKDLMKFYSKRDVFLASISGVVFYAGLVSSIILFFTSSSPINYVIMGIYAVVILFKIFGIMPKKPGYVLDANGFPVSFGIIRVFSSALGREVAHTVIGKTGKYYLLVSNGEYYVKIQQKISENEYKDVYTSGNITIKNGHLSKKFKINN